jgi:hypothetical protein
MSLNVPKTATNMVEWVRLAANAINDLIFHVDVLDGKATALREDVDTLQAFQASFTTLPNYADDASASTGGVPVGGLYRNGSQVMVRVA